MGNLVMLWEYFIIFLIKRAVFNWKLKNNENRPTQFSFFFQISRAEKI